MLLAFLLPSVRIKYLFMAPTPRSDFKSYFRFRAEIPPELLVFYTPVRPKPFPPGSNDLHQQLVYHKVPKNIVT